MESGNDISDNLVKLSPVQPEQVVTTKVPTPDYPVDEIVDHPGLEQVALEETPLCSVPAETNIDLVEKDNTVNSLPPEERVSYVLFEELYSTYDSSELLELIIDIMQIQGAAIFLLKCFKIFWKYLFPVACKNYLISFKMNLSE